MTRTGVRVRAPLNHVQWFGGEGGRGEGSHFFLFDLPQTVDRNTVSGGGGGGQI